MHEYSQAPVSGSQAGSDVAALAVAENVKLYGLIKRDCKQTEFMTQRRLSSQMQSSLQLVNIIKKDFSSTHLFM